jgi:uncharacterized protein YlxW (UPF0749 family)
MNGEEEMPDSPSETPLAAEPVKGRARLVAALRRPTSRAQFTAGVLLAILGFAAVVQVQANHQDDQYVGARQSDLITLINQLSLASQRANNEIAQLRQTRDSLRSDTDSRRTAIERAKEQANTLGILAGTLPAVGPGVRVTVNDPHGSVGTDQLLDGIEELRDAGAEAIEINNSERVVAQTSFQDAADGGVVVAGKVLTPPYTIDAIGDPHTLATALNFTGGFIFNIEQVKGTVKIDQADDVEIATTRPLSTPKYAQQTPTQ